MKDFVYIKSNEYDWGGTIQRFERAKAVSRRRCLLDLLVVLVFLGMCARAFLHGRWLGFAAMCAATLAYVLCAIPELQLLMGYGRLLGHLRAIQKLVQAGKFKRNNSYSWHHIEQLLATASHYGIKLDFEDIR